MLDADGNFTSYPNVWSWGNEGQAHGALRPGMGVSEYRMGPEYGFGACVRHTRALYFVFGFSPPRPPLRECRSCRQADRR